MNQEKVAMSRKAIQVATAAGVIFSIILFMVIRGYPEYFAVDGHFQQWLSNLGFWGVAIFVLFQTIQVIYPVIPGGLTSVIGHALFGPFLGFVYNFIGIFTGSIVAFLLARRYGEVFVQAFVSQETYDKYRGYINRGRFFERFLIVAFILPGFPDDFLCMVSGMSKMPLKKFVWIALLSKPVTLYLYTVIGYYGLQSVFQLLN